jgi:glycosyltransferase involved in cell wall biosynthesis
MRLYRRIDLVVLRRFPRIVAVSENLRRELIAAGLSPDRICVIPNGIDVARFAEGAGDRASEWRRRAAEPGAPVILTVGRLYRQKGLEYFVPLLSKLAGIPPVDRAISWGYGTRSARGEIRLPGSAVPISQGPASPAWR